LGCRPDVADTIGVRISVPGSEDDGHVDQLVPDVVAAASFGALGSRAQVEDEIDLMLTTLRSFYAAPADVVMRKCSALSARCTQLAIHLVRLEGRHEWRRLRTMQVERLLAEIDRQHRIASRLLEGRRLEWETSRENSK
jgi:hypothetical protein